MSGRRNGQRLGSPALFNARAHEATKETARLARIAALDVRPTPAKASLESVRPRLRKAAR